MFRGVAAGAGTSTIGNRRKWHFLWKYIDLVPVWPQIGGGLLVGHLNARHKKKACLAVDHDCSEKRRRAVHRAEYVCAPHLCKKWKKNCDFHQRVVLGRSGADKWTHVRTRGNIFVIVFPQQQMSDGPLTSGARGTVYEHNPRTRRATS